MTGIAMFYLAIRWLRTHAVVALMIAFFSAGCAAQERCQTAAEQTPTKMLLGDCEVEFVCLPHPFED